MFNTTGVRTMPILIAILLSLVGFVDKPALRESPPVIQPMGPVTKPVLVRTFAPRESVALQNARNRYTYLNYNCAGYGYGYGGPWGYGFLYNYYSCQGLLPFGSFGWGFAGPSY